MKLGRDDIPGLDIVIVTTNIIPDPVLTVQHARFEASFEVMNCQKKLYFLCSVS